MTFAFSADTTGNRNRCLLLSLAMILCVFIVPAFAHGGFDHVIGNVIKVSGNVVTVKTSTGIVEVKLDAKTEISKDKQPAHIGDLAPGARMVIDIPEGSGDKVAHAVKIGTGTAADHDAHK